MTSASNLVAACVLALVVACGGTRATTPAAVGPAPAKIVQLNKPGEMVRVALEPGFVTVVDFWGDHCGACKIIGAQLEAGTAAEPKILIRKIDIGDGFTPVAQAYEITTLPHLRIFDKRGEMRHVLVGNETVKAAELARALAAEP